MQVNLCDKESSTREMDMTRTHNEAIALLQTGNVDKAWEVAQKDEGLNKGVTKEVWVVFAERCIANQNACDKAYEASF